MAKQAVITKAYYTVNPVYVGQATILRVKVLEVDVTPIEDTKLTGEALTGED